MGVAVESMRAEGKHMEEGDGRECFQGEVLAQTLEFSSTKWLAEFCMENKAFSHVQENRQESAK